MGALGGGWEKGASHSQITEGRIGKQTDSSAKDATNTQSDFYIWVQNEKVFHHSVNLT